MQLICKFSLKFLVVFIILSSHNWAAGGANPYELAPGVSEEGWRWRYTFASRIGEVSILPKGSLDAIHNRLSDNEQMLTEMGRPVPPWHFPIILPQ